MSLIISVIVKPKVYSMEQKKVTFDLKSEDFLRISSFFSHAKATFPDSSFIKDFGILDIVLFIYRRHHLQDRQVTFSTIKEYSTRSDVYLSNTLKNGLEADYWGYRVSETDKRLKEYFLKEKALAFIEKLKRFDLQE